MKNDLIDGNEKESFLNLCYDYEFINSYDIDKKVRNMLLEITNKEAE